MTTAQTSEIRKEVESGLAKSEPPVIEVIGKLTTRNHGGYRDPGREELRILPRYSHSDETPIANDLCKHLAKRQPVSSAVAANHCAS